AKEAPTVSQHLFLPNKNKHLKRALLAIPFSALALLLASCGNDNGPQLPTPTVLGTVTSNNVPLVYDTPQAGTVTLCHATSDPNNPYLLVTVDSADVQQYFNYPDDIIP